MPVFIFSKASRNGVSHKTVTVGVEAFGTSGVWFQLAFKSSERSLFGSQTWLSQGASHITFSKKPVPHQPIERRVSSSTWIEGATHYLSPLKDFQGLKSWIIGCPGTAKPVCGQAERPKCCSSGDISRHLLVGAHDLSRWCYKSSLESVRRAVWDRP